MCNSDVPMENNNGNGSSDETTRSTEQAMDLNSWLPITASRKAKWWYSAFHNVTAMVGAGVLGLPFAMSQLGWVPGMIAIVMSWLVTFYTLWQLVELHEIVPGKRFDRYPELGQHALGEKLGCWVVMPQQLLVQVASNIVYMVTGGKSLKKCVDLVIVSTPIKQTYFIIFFAFWQLILSQIPNFNSLKLISLLAALMSVSYSMVAFVTSVDRGVHHHQEVRHGVRGENSSTEMVFDVFNSLGTIAFAFAGHSVVLEIQATIPSSPPNNPSKRSMWRGVIVAYIIVAFCYFSVALSGFWAFGITVEDDVLVSLHQPLWLIAAANLMVFLHVLGSYQVFAMPVFDTIESLLVKKLRFTPGTSLRLTARSAYVVLTAFIGICIPFFGGLLGFFGGLAFASTSYFLPCVMWLVLQHPKRWSFHWIASWVSITIGILITILAPIGGARSIIKSYNEYKLFS